MIRSVRRALLCAAAGVAIAGGSMAFASLALAQDAGSAVDEVVVTGSRMSEYDAAQTPHVTVIKRADNLVVEVRIVCDTRDLSQRMAEMRATIRSLVKEAGKDASIELGQGDEIVGAFDDTMIDSIISPDSKADTSAALLLIKTPVSATDTFDAASGRIRGFIKRVAKSGRTEVLIQGDWQLTLIGPTRHRPEIIAAIATDAKRAAAEFGPGYGVKITGLEHPIEWYRAAPLDLALFIPYRLEIEPVGH